MMKLLQQEFLSLNRLNSVTAVCQCLSLENVWTKENNVEGQM